MSIHDYAELRSRATGAKIATLWNHSAFATYMNAGYGPTIAQGSVSTDPEADALVALIGEAGTTPAADGAWWATVPGAENAAGMFVERVTGLAGAGVSAREVLSSINRDSAIVGRRAASARVFTITGHLFGLDEASVQRMRSQLARLLDPNAQRSDDAGDDLQVWWPEVCEAGDSCLAKPGNCTGVHWKYVTGVALVDGADLDFSGLGRGDNLEGAIRRIRLRCVASDPRIYLESPAPTVLTLDTGIADTPPADPTCGTVSVNIDLPKSALPIRLNPDRTFCEIGWDIGTRVVSETYITVGELEPVYVPPTAPNVNRIEPYGIRVFWNEYQEAVSAGTGKTWEKINPARWPSDGSFPTDAPIEIQQLRVWVPGVEPPIIPTRPTAPYQVHLFWEPNAYDSTRERFVWEPINDQRWPSAVGGIRPMPTDAEVEIGLVTFPNPDYDSSQPVGFDNQRWRTITAPRGSEPYRVRLGTRPAGQLHGIARAVDWTLPNWNSTGTEATTDITHIVVAGNTLSGIAATYGTTVAAIQAANPWLANPNVIIPGWAITIPDQAADTTTSSFEINFPPPLARFEVYGTSGQYGGGGFHDPGTGAVGPRGQTIAQIQAENRRDATLGEWVAEANRGSEFFDIVLTQNGRWAEAAGTWDVDVFGVPPDGGQLRVLPDFNTDVVETDPAAVDPYACPPLDPELAITIDTGARTWAPSGWAFEGEWPNDSVLVIPAEVPGTYVEAVDIHDPNCVACGPNPGCDLEVLFGESVYVADPPLALTNVATGTNIGTPPAAIERSFTTVGPADPADPFDIEITLDPGAATMANYRLLLWENNAEAGLGSLQRCDAYRYRFAALPTGASLIFKTRTRELILDCGDGTLRDAAALMTAEDGGRPIWPEYMAGRWTVAIEVDPGAVGTGASASILQLIADPVV